MKIGDDEILTPGELRLNEIDDTPLGESDESDESVTRKEMDELLFECIKKLSDEVLEAIEDRDKVIRGLMLRVANLESRKPPQDTNPDPEWYS